MVWFFLQFQLIMNKLTNIQYWEAIQAAPNIFIDKNDIVKKWIESNLYLLNIKNCLEIGCYPGRYLSIFAKNGIEVNGIDYIPRVIELYDLFKSSGYNAGEFYCGDFLNIKINRKYDCVYSLGFLEHFENWEDVFIKHFELLSDGGVIIIEVPNFRGWLQCIPRFLFDRKNLKRHNIKSMHLGKWRNILLKNNFEIIYSGYFGGYSLWFEDKINSNTIKLFKIIVINILRLIKNIIFRNKLDHKCFSAAIGVIAKKLT
jgi:L-malate glycosyltransferase